MQLKHIEYFVETSKYKSFNEAAKNLFISQPSLSAAIATLEKELGFKLFSRTKQGIKLTSAGNLILPEAKQMLSIQRHWTTLSQKFTLLNAPLTIITQELLCSTILVNFSINLHNLYPNVTLNLKAEEMFSINNHLEENIIFLCLFDINQFDEQKKMSEKSNWTIVPVASLQALLYLNTTNPLSNQKLITLSDLHGLNIVTYDSKSLETLPYNNLITKFSSIYKLPTREGILNYIHSSPKSYALLSSLCMYHPFVRNGSITTKTIMNYPLPIFLAAIYPKDADLASFYETIVDEICKTTHDFIQENNILV